MGKGRRPGNQNRAAAVNGELRAVRDATGMRAWIDLTGLERRDLRQVEDVHDVDARPGQLDAAEPVDREVAERVRGGDRRYDQGGEHGEEEDDALHADHL